MGKFTGKNIDNTALNYTTSAVGNVKKADTGASLVMGRCWHLHGSNIRRTSFLTATRSTEREKI